MKKSEVLSRIRRKLEEQNVSEACIEAILHALESKEILQVSTIVFRKKDVHEMLLMAKDQQVVAHSSTFHFSFESSGFQATSNCIPWLVTKQEDLLYVYI